MQVWLLREMRFILGAQYDTDIILKTEHDGAACDV